MWTFYVSFLTLIYLRAGNSEPYTHKNLIFVYDVINPGMDYSEFIEGIGKIYNELFQPGPYQIFNKLLVVFPFKTSVEIYSFDDADGNTIVKKMLQDKSIIEEEKTLGNVSRVLTGLWQGLYNGNPNSLIYVFTNSHPEDNSMMYAITCAIENKMIEVGFIIKQNYPERGIPEEYKIISTQSNGLIMNVHKDTQIMGFLSSLLTSTKNKVNLLTTNIVSNKPHTVLVDRFVDEITIATWTFDGVGQYITYHHYHSDYIKTTTFTNEPLRIRHLCTIKTYIESFKYISLGHLSINVDTNSYHYGLRVFGISGFNFDYGFSTNKNNCTGTMYKRPITNVLNYIYVTTTNKEYEAVFKSCKIIATDNSFTREISLQRITSSEDDLYYGTFVPNFQPFYIQVTALIANEVVQRMSSFAISPIYQKSMSEFERNDVEFSSNYSSMTYYGTTQIYPSNYGNSTHYQPEIDQNIKFIPL